MTVAASRESAAGYLVPECGSSRDAATDLLLRSSSCWSSSLSSLFWLECYCPRFADGHSEIKKWTSRTSKYPVTYSYPSIIEFDAAGKNDFQWYRERTGYVTAAGSAGLYGY